MKKFLFFLWYGFFILIPFTSDAQTSTGQWSVWAGSDGNDMEIYYVHHEAGQSATPQRITQDNALHESSPSIVVGEDGKPVVVWMREDQDRREIYCSKWDGTKWSQEELVGDSVGIRFGQPAVTLDEEGEIWVVAAGVSDKNVQGEIYWTRSSSAGWSGWAQLNQEDAAPDIDPSIVSFNKKIWVVWSGFDGRRYRLFNRVWDQEKWSEEAQVFLTETTVEEFPSLSIRQGKLHLVFYQDQNTLLSHWEDKNWSNPISFDVPIEAAFIDVWKNQGVYRSHTGWFHRKEDQGSQIILREQNASSAPTPKLISRLRNFFKIKGSEAWAAGTPNVYSAFGDSITLGYPALLEGKLNARFGPSTVVNRGRGGERTPSGISRIDSVLNADNPEFILIMEGQNDAGDERFPEFIAFNLEVMIDKSIAFGTRPIISTITPRLDDHNGNVENTNDLIRGLAGSKGIPLVDNYVAIESRPGFESLYVDHIHFNDGGNEVIAQSWFNVINGAKGGGGDGGGGCGFVHPTSGNRWNINLEPLFFILLFLIFVSAVRRVSQSR